MNKHALNSIAVLCICFFFTNGISQDLHLVALDFWLDSVPDSLNYLEKELPEALEAEILNSCNSIKVLERNQHLDVLEEIEYEYNREGIFNDSTINKLNKQIGANSALIGKVKHRAGEVRIDIKVVKIETGERQFQGYSIANINDLQSFSQIALNMRELSQNLCHHFQPSQSIPDFEVEYPQNQQRLPANQVITAYGTHSISLEENVWAVLGDTYGNFYLQNPPVQLRNERWSCTGIRPGNGIIEINFVRVTNAGHMSFQNKVSNSDFGAFTNLPSGSEIISKVYINVE
ncbi:MAG TPA: hypothetical protein PLP19_22190 [bacterium]|nr:hypothetical protein [bacterium]HPN46211.1 hypothetical protein [bacterium]